MYAKGKDKLFDWVRAYEYNIGASAYRIGICAMARFPIMFSGVRDGLHTPCVFGWMNR